MLEVFISGARSCSPTASQAFTASRSDWAGSKWTPESVYWLSGPEENFGQYWINIKTKVNWVSGTEKKYRKVTNLKCCCEWEAWDQTQVYQDLEQTLQRLAQWGTKAKTRELSSSKLSSIPCLNYEKSVLKMNRCMVIVPTDSFLYCRSELVARPSRQSSDSSLYRVYDVRD
jgi:hypothetical protein